MEVTLRSTVVTVHVHVPCRDATYSSASTVTTITADNPPTADTAAARPVVLRRPLQNQHQASTEVWQRRASTVEEAYSDSDPVRRGSSRNLSRMNGGGGGHYYVVDVLTPEANDVAQEDEIRSERCDAHAYIRKSSTELLLK